MKWVATVWKPDSKGVLDQCPPVDGQGIHCRSIPTIAAYFNFPPQSISLAKRLRLTSIVDVQHINLDKACMRVFSNSYCLLRQLYSSFHVEVDFSPTFTVFNKHSFSSSPSVACSQGRFTP